MVGMGGGGRLEGKKNSQAQGFSSRFFPQVDPPTRLVHSRWWTGGPALCTLDRVRTGNRGQGPEPRCPRAVRHVPVENNIYIYNVPVVCNQLCDLETMGELLYASFESRSATRSVIS